MIKIKEISDSVYEDFMACSNQKSFYQSLEWKNVKQLEGKKCELLGFYSENLLVAVSLIVYVPFFKKFSYAYASRGIVGDYSYISDITLALYDYFKLKNIAFFRMDPLVELNRYDSKLNKFQTDNNNVIDQLKKLGYIHFGYNYGFETTQFRFVHVLDLKNDFNVLLENMSKSTKKNMEIAKQKGACVEKTSDFDLVYSFFEQSSNRKNFKSLSKRFYDNIIKSFNDNCFMYLVYIDKKKLINNLNGLLEDLKIEDAQLKDEMEHSHVGSKLLKRKENINNARNKYLSELQNANELEDKTYIASMFMISKYDEIVSLASGMNNDYRSFCPKYVMYPEMMQEAIKMKKKRVNFLGVENIFDKDSKSYGMYEVKKGFGGETVEYIGEFDLPINKIVYKLFKFKEKNGR